MRQPALSAFSPAAPSARTRAAVEVEYPSSDGKPLAENDAQLAAIVYGITVLRTRYAGRDDVYVSGDLLLYYEEGNPRVSVAPDVFVVFGVEDRMRMNYKVWEEGKGPDFVLEVASPGTWRKREDVGRKREVYAGLGVREYWLYDPMGGLHLTSRAEREAAACCRGTVAWWMGSTSVSRWTGMHRTGRRMRRFPGREGSWLTV